MYNKPNISVCIPVFNTEKYLSKCLDSVINQDFESFEIVIVNDSSKGVDKFGHKTKKIVKIAEKKCKRIRKEKKLPFVRFVYLEHNKHLGTLETRRTLFNNSSGDYIIQLDSDDQYVEKTLSLLYKYTDKFEIVHGSHLCVSFDENGNFTEDIKNKNKNLLVWNGELFEHDVFHKYFCEGKITCILWSKLIKRDLYEKAFEQIPFSNICFNGDMLLYFFISLFAKSYIGLSDIVYLYGTNSGVTSSNTIFTIDAWKQKCAVSGVINIINDYVNHNPFKLNKKELKSINNFTYTFVHDLLFDLNYIVTENIRKEAFEVLCDYWGKDIILNVSKELNLPNLRNIS